MSICDDVHRLVMNLGYETRREKWVAGLSDRNLFDALTACNRDVGPVLDSTRDLYRKMLIDLLKTGSISKIVESIDRHLASSTDALEHWEKAGMRSLKLNADDHPLNEVVEKEEKWERYSNTGSTGGGRRRSPTPGGSTSGSSYASALTRVSGSTGKEELPRESTPLMETPRTPRKLASPFSTPSWPDLNSASAAEPRQTYRQFDSGSSDEFIPELYTIRKREKGGSEVRDSTLDSEPKEVQGNLEIGQERRSDLKTLILAFICGFSLIYAIYYFLLNFDGEGGSEIQMDPEFKDELDLLIKEAENIGRAEQ